MSTEATRTERTLSAYVAQEIRAYMGRKDINKTELARRLGVSDMWVGRRLRGQLPIDLDDLVRIAAALKIDIVDLLPNRGQSLNDGSETPTRRGMRTRLHGRPPTGPAPIGSTVAPAARRPTPVVTMSDTMVA